MKRTLLLLLVVCGFATSVPVFGHHAIGAIYREDQVVTIQGDVVSFKYQNPHSYVTVVTPEGKELQKYSVEWGGGGLLTRQGITRETLKPGDHLIVTGNPSRDPADHRIYLRRIVRPRDGWRWERPAA
jgi:hypothetical protein